MGIAFENAMFVIKFAIATAAAEDSRRKLQTYVLSTPTSSQQHFEQLFLQGN